MISNILCFFYRFCYMIFEQGFFVEFMNLMRLYELFFIVYISKKCFYFISKSLVDFSNMRNVI